MRELDRQIMRAENKLDVYDDENCDEGCSTFWFGSAEGDKDGDGDIGGTIELATWTFPPGAVVTVTVPICPECGESIDMSFDHETSEIGPCDCGFDWNKWAMDEYS